MVDRELGRVDQRGRRRAGSPAGQAGGPDAYPVRSRGTASPERSRSSARCAQAANGPPRPAASSAVAEHGVRSAVADHEMRREVGGGPAGAAASGRPGRARPAGRRAPARSRAASDGEEAVIAGGYRWAESGAGPRTAISSTNERVASEPRVRPCPPAVPTGVPVARRRDAVVRRGLRHIGRRSSSSRGMFTLAVLASSLYGAMTVASAYVIGEITDRVLLPSFADGATTAAALALAALAIIGVAAAEDRRHRRPPAVRRDHELPAAGRLPPPGHRPVPAAAAVLAPAAPHRPAAVQRELRRRGGLVLRGPAAVRVRRAGHARDHRRRAGAHRSAARPGRAWSSSRWCSWSTSSTRRS